MPLPQPHQLLWRPYAIGLLTFLFACAVAAAAVWQSERSAYLHRRGELGQLAADKAHEVERGVQRALTATYALAALVRQGRGTVADFDEVATELLPFYPGADALQLAPGGIIRAIVPLAGNEKAIGHDLLADPERTKEAFLARATGRLTLAGPFHLMQGGLGAVGRLPVYLDEESGARTFWGFVTVLIRFPEALTTAQLPQLTARGLDYELWRIHPDTGERQMIAASSPRALTNPVDRSVDMPNGPWTLSVAPVDGWGAGSLVLPKVALAAMFSVLLAWAAKQMAELRLHRRSLELLVAERTAEVAAREAKLSALLGSLPDALLVIDESGRIAEFNPPAGGIGQEPTQQFVGRTYREWLPVDVGDAFDEALAAIARDGQRREVEYALDLPAGRRQFGASLSRVDSAARPAGFLALVRDITDRKAVEERMSEAMVVFEASSQGIMTADAYGRIQSVNPAFCHITGFSPEDVIGQTPAMFKSGRHDDAFYAGLWSALRGSGKWEGEIWNRRKSGEIYAQWLTISAVRNSAGETVKYISLFSDITRRKEREEVIWRQANFDALTGLANRNLLHDRLQRALAQSRRSGRKVGLIFLDLDGFKWINDSLGHDVGDEMLVEVARRLQQSVRECDTVARLGGDEFTLIVEDLPGGEDLHVVGEKVRKILLEPFVLAGCARHISGSMGITVFPDDGEDVQILLRNADIAMYQSKQLGKNRYQFYAHYMQENARARVQLESELRTAIREKAFALYYQPIVDARTGLLTGAEALVRWNHPERGLVSPQEFIPVAEDTGLIVAIGAWVLTEAASQSRRWVEKGLQRLRIAVNVSGVQFREAGLPELISDLDGDFELAKGSLVLEITESVLMDSSDVTEARMRDIMRFGVAYSLDDFGTGFSSLSYLKRFPVQNVKIDRTFVRDCPEDRNDVLLVEAIINMAHSLGLKVTAEGVETEAQRDFLCRAGCDYLQGFLVSKPLPADQFEALWAGMRAAKESTLP